MATPIQIPGLHVAGEIGRGAHSVVYRATKDAQVVAVKVSTNDDSDLEIRREAAHLACLKHPSLAGILEVGDAAGRPYVVMEYVDGITLAQMLQTEGQLPEPRIVDIARQVAGALAVVHRHGLVHRDVKPANVLVADDGVVKLIDFGFAIRPGSAGLASASAKGTVAYCAPEQLRMLSRPVDGRADLYALGAVLFECAAGRPPFDAKDVTAVLQAHLTSEPPNLAELRPDLSPQLVAVIHRLLSKEPSDRPPSAIELLAALDVADEQTRMEQGSRLSPLVGRAAEFAILRRHWKRALKGDGTAVLVEGAPGAGKTRLAEELLAGVRMVGGLVLEVQCSKGDATPFSALRRGVEGYLEAVEALAVEEGESASDRIRALAGDSGPLIASFSDVLKAHVELGGAAPHERVFFEAVAELIMRIIEPHPAAVLFIDDAQWLDEGSREVVARVADRLADAPLLILATARNDPASADEVRRMISALGTTGLTRIELAPLTASAIATLLNAHLGGGEVDRTVVQRLVARTGGNPFALEVYVHAMLDAGMLRPSWGTWIADLDSLDSVELPSDVTALVMHRLDAVPVELRAVLEVAAVIGRRFSVDLICEAIGADLDRVHAAIDAAAGAHLVTSTLAEHAFAHDRVREAILSSLIADRTKDLHHRVAAALARRSEPTRDDVYALARHAALGDPEVDVRRAYTSSRNAGLLAFDERGDHLAIAFLKRAWALTARAGVDPDPRVAERLGDAYARLGRVDDSVSAYERCLELTGDGVARADILGRMASARIANGDAGTGWRDVKAAFADLGHVLPRTSIRRWFVTAWDLVAGLIAVRRSSPAAEQGQERDRVLARLYEIGTLLAFYNLDDANLTQMTLRPLRAALRFGPSRELVNAYVNYAYAAAHLRWPSVSARFFERAIELAKSLDSPSELSRTLHVQASAVGASGDVLSAVQLHEACLTAHERTLEPLYYLNGCVELAWIFLLRGYPRDAWRWVARGTKLVSRDRGAGASLDGHPIHAYAASTLASNGRMTEAQAQLQRYRVVAERAPDEKYRWAELFAHAMIVQIERGDLGGDVDALIDRHHRLAPNPAQLPGGLRHFYVFAAHARLEQCRADVDAGAPPRVGALSVAAAVLRSVASTPLLEAHAALIDGALARLRGDAIKSARHLALAEDLARRVDCAWVLADASWERAEILAGDGYETAAARIAMGAYHQLMGSGRRGRAQRLVSRFSLEVSDPEPASVSTSIDFRSHHAALLRVSLATATEIDPDQQARAALDEAVSLLRAERAFLFVTQPGQHELALQVGRDASGEALRSLEAYSRTVVERVRSAREPMIVSGSDEGLVLGSQSAVTHGLRSIVAVPLMLRERLMGVLYMDNRIADGVFTAGDLDILMAIGNHIVISRETVRTAKLATYARVASNVPGMVFQLMMDPDGPWRFQYVSPACRDLFGLDPEHVLADADRFFQQIHPEDRGDLMRSLRGSAQRSSPWRWEGRATAGGEERWLQGAARPEAQASGCVLWDGLIMDISTRRRAEDALERQARELARSNQDLEQFAYAASHDLQEPLRVVASYMQLLSRRYKGKLDADADEFIGFAVDGAKRMQHMIKALLQYSRVGTHGRQFELRSLRALYDIAIANLGAAIAESGAEVVCGELPTLEVDETQMVQLLQNLIGNAIKFRRDVRPEIRVDAAWIDDRWQVSVTDNGIGIDPEYADRIFGIFQRLHTHEEYAGAGVGLAVCKKIVERHGGSIWVDSTIGEGTTFHFTLAPDEADDSEFSSTTVVEDEPP